MMGSTVLASTHRVTLAWYRQHRFWCFVAMHEMWAQWNSSRQWCCTGCRCKTRQRAVKQMSVRRLPPVLCFHAKRFEHHLAGGGRKLDTPLLCASTPRPHGVRVKSTVCAGKTPERFVMSCCRS